MKLISNHKHPAHLNTIWDLLKNSEQVIICVAFLKNSGLNNIIKRLPSNSTFYIGTDYFITEPSAIKQLIQKGYTVYLTKKAQTTFHPKIYYFKSAKSISILTGSANLTGGGLETNFETSFLFETQRGSIIDKDFKLIIDNYIENSTQIISDLQISQYERQFDSYRKKHKKADQEFQQEMESLPEIDVMNIDKDFKTYLKEVGLERYKVRVSDYNKIRRLLDNITTVKISSANEFLYYYEEIANSFYSSDLLRGKTIFAKKYKTIISVIKSIRENKTKDAAYVYSKAHKLILSVDRFGVNALTEIMNTYNPTKFSVANGRTLKSLANARFPEFPVSNKKYFNAEIYEKYNKLIQDIAIKCNAKDLGQVDHFLSWYYDKYVR